MRHYLVKWFELLTCPMVNHYKIYCFSKIFKERDYFILNMNFRDSNSSYREK